MITGSRPSRYRKRPGCSETVHESRLYQLGIFQDSQSLAVIKVVTNPGFSAATANDLSNLARTKKLMPEEVQGGTFTVTNRGVFGGLFGTPIINGPQVTILCVGTIEKRPRVMTTPDGDDYIAIRQMAYFALTYDHRIVNGADAEKFLAYMKGYLESAPFST